MIFSVLDPLDEAFRSHPASQACKSCGRTPPTNSRSSTYASIRTPSRRRCVSHPSTRC
ncbi:hypothetical protein BDV95DRAFT_586341 [Massariosphaeria phaeospora]|uniref:Uncharacterized protein n=1 Tax=Massariosphaeria phaeospora TaxID=100035 RepID=A0A7C8HZ14_9PLEO|nr:hypothetical protein BDV95DRAFT_586341 [Massariosphaeria phaeospora]